MRFFCVFMLYYYICSIFCTILLWKKFHKEENKEKLENDLAKFVSDSRGTHNLTRDDVLVGYYLATVFFSFIIAPISLLNKIIGRKNAR